MNESKNKYGFTFDRICGSMVFRTKVGTLREWYGVVTVRKPYELSRWIICTLVGLACLQQWKVVIKLESITISYLKVKREYIVIAKSFHIIKIPLIFC